MCESSLVEVVNDVPNATQFLTEILSRVAIVALEGD